MALLKETYNVVSLVTEGMYGELYLAKDIKDNNQLRIVKVVPFDDGGKDNKVEKMYKGECRVYQKIANSEYSEFFPKYFENFNMQGSGILILECLGASIFEVRRQNHHKSFCTENVVKLGWAVFRGLTYLHRAGFMHMDIHEKNVVFTRPFNPSIPIKILDFGAALNFKTRSGRQKTVKCSMDHKKCAFSSLALNQGLDPVPKDDFESLFYLIMCMSNKFQMYGSSEEMVKMKKKLHFEPHKVLNNNRYLVNLWLSIAPQNRDFLFNTGPVETALKNGGIVDLAAQISCAEVGRYFVVE